MAEAYIGPAMSSALAYVQPLFAEPKTAPIAKLPDFVPGQSLSFDSMDDGMDGESLATLERPSSALSGAEPDTAVRGGEAPARQVSIIAEPDPKAVIVDAVAPSVPAEGAGAQDAMSSMAGVRTAALGVEPPARPTAPIIPAKTLFGAAKTASPLAARAIGTYARGCLSGAVALPADGPAWQAMRLSRNRRWGHPNLVSLVERLAKDAKTLDGWPGLLVGDISQPRGGPMLTGHASHQIGLDADVWLTPMPDRKLSPREREDISATSMLDKTDLAVDPNIFSDAHVRLIKRAASYPEVERVLVHPAIKKALCQAAGSDRAWLGKVRPIGGHYYHFHVRISCPPGSSNCKPQKPVTGDDGCAKEVDEWLARLAPPKTPPPPKPPGYKPTPPAPPITLAQLPHECTAVLESGPDGVAIPAAARVPVPLTPVLMDPEGEPLPLKSAAPAQTLNPANASAALRPHVRRLETQ